MNQLTLAVVLAASLTASSLAIAGECPYESLLASWQQVEEGAGKSAEMLMPPGVRMTVEHITVCRNGAAVFLHGRPDGASFAVRFIRANQDSFQDVLRSRFAIEERVSFEGEDKLPGLTAEADGRVVLEWKGRSTEIVGERSVYVSPEETRSPVTEDGP